MLLDKEWQDADLAEIVRLEMSPYGGRVEVEGPSLMLKASAAQSFTLALHELATNAASMVKRDGSRAHQLVKA
jgi:two-component sensor histidine kinase